MTPWYHRTLFVNRNGKQFTPTILATSFVLMVIVPAAIGVAIAMLLRGGI